MTVVLANHGREALDILAQDPHFDGVLMDCQMPVMDGYAATREIRRNPTFKDLPIIAMTANAMTGAKEQVLEAGMWDYIVKPLDVGAMFTTLAKWIRPATPAENPPGRSAPGAPQTGEAIISGLLGKVSPADAVVGVEGGASGPVALAKAVDSDKLEPVRARLLELLDQGDASTVDYLEEHEALLRAAYPSQWRGISASVKNYDFDAARSLIQQTA
jgi:CheY-like chemotaxis protein